VITYEQIPVNPRQHRRRNAEATAARILHAAQRVFHEKGYDGATTREIADRAGNNLNLINRYFGSKLGLFEQAVLPRLSLKPFLKGPRETLAKRLADFYAMPEPKDDFDPFVVLVRSIASQEAGPLLMAHLHEHSVEPLAAYLDGPGKIARATLISTQLAGLILRFRIMRQLPIDDEERQALRDKLEIELRNIIAE
jgi:AcrR family transcriptional regulator